MPHAEGTRGAISPVAERAEAPVRRAIGRVCVTESTRPAHDGSRKRDVRFSIRLPRFFMKATLIIRYAMATMKKR